MQVCDENDLQGGQRSSEVKCGKLYGYQTWSEESLLQVHDDPHGGQTLSEVKCDKLLYGYLIGQKNP